MEPDTPDARPHAEEHLRRFVAARERGDRAEMRRWWEELVVDVFDRMDNLVHLAHQGRLDDEEHQDAVSMALARFSNNLMITFRGTSMGELINATKTLARGICIDVQRAAERRQARSLDEGWDAADDDRPSPAWEAGEALARHEREQRATDARGFLDWALPQIGEDRRRVLELSLHGVDADEIAAALQISRDNAYQRRSRGIRDLRRLKERYDT